MDNVRTPAPCGMPKGAAKTSLIVNKQLNITWHLGYPHQGGFKLELFDSDENLVKSLTPINGGSKGKGWIDQDTTAQSYNVIFDEECKDCTVKKCCLKEDAFLPHAFLIFNI